MIDFNSTLEELQKFSNNTLIDNLGIEYLEVAEGFVKAKMPVDKRTKQPLGILHGGASLALAETIGSMGSALLVDLNKFDVRGASISANHIGSIIEGFVYGIAKIVHKGNYTHVWDILITDKNERKISISRLTNMIIVK